MAFFKCIIYSYLGTANHSRRVLISRRALILRERPPHSLEGITHVNMLKYCSCSKFYQHSRGESYVGGQLFYF